MRVLFVSCDPLEGAVTRYRCTHLAEALRMAGHTADVATIYDPVIRLEHDIVVLHRICANKEGQALADAVRKSGATLIYGADDLVWEEGPLAHLHLAMLKQADEVLVNTVCLQVAFSEVGANGSIVRNFLSQEQWQISNEARQNQKTHQGVRLAYLSGTPTHDDDLATIAVDLENVLRKFPQTELWLVGPVVVPENLKLFGSRIVNKSLVPWRALPQLISEVDICLAPLAKTRFNRAKSEVKFLEAGAVGVPTLSSCWGGFESIAGLGCRTVPWALSWEGALSELIQDESVRKEQGKKARDGVRELCGIAMQFAEDFFLDSYGIGIRKVNTIHPTTFTNPRGFAKGMVKKTLRRLKA